MGIQEKLNKTLEDLKSGNLDSKECIDTIFFLFGIPQSLTVVKEWEEEPECGWTSWGWFYENGGVFDEVGYELEEILETDKHGNATKARFKYVG